MVVALRLLQVAIQEQRKSMVAIQIEERAADEVRGLYDAEEEEVVSVQLVPRLQRTSGSNAAAAGGTHIPPHTLCLHTQMNTLCAALACGTPTCLGVRHPPRPQRKGLCSLLHHAPCGSARNGLLPRCTLVASPRGVATVHSTSLPRGPSDETE